jgi:peptidoglycan/LPS O-acetylase OafA/YrhL
VYKFINIFNKKIRISNISRIDYRIDITTLRAVAVLAVVFYHAEFKLFKGGWLGVDIFFVISGFLISNIIISELNNNTFTFREFYLRRVRRILPALTSTLLISIPFAYFLLSPLALLEYGKSLISSIFFYSNYYFNTLDFYNAEPSRYLPLLHTWSLSIEEQFYILFPGFVFIVYKFKKHALFIFLNVLFVTSIFLNSLTPSNDKFYEIQFRIWELLLGAIVMMVYINVKIKNTHYLGTIFIFYAILSFDDTLINNIEPKLIVNIGTALVLLNSKKNLSLKNSYSILLTKYFEKIGLISYSLYLLHQPFFAFLRITFKKYQIQESIIATSIFILVLIVISNLQYQLIEKRFLKKRSLNLKHVIFLAPILLFSIYISQSQGVTRQYEAVYSNLEKYYSEEQRGGAYFKDCDLNYDLFCKSGNKDLPNLIIIGDSHLTTLSKYIQDNIDYEKYNLVVMAKQGCPFFLPEMVSERGQCSNSEKYNTLIQEMNDESIVIFGGRFPRYFTGVDFESNYGSIDDKINANPDLYEDVTTTLNFISQNNKLGIFIYPIPELGLFPLEYYLNKFLQINESLSYERSYWDDYTRESNIYLDALTYSNIIKIKSQEIFCSEIIKDRCTAAKNGTMFYWDDDHLSYDGASFLGVKILEIVNKLDN